MAGKSCGRYKAGSSIGGKLIVDQEELFQYNTINAMWKQSMEENSEKKTGMEYATADMYPFSKEIQLSYAVYPEERDFMEKRIMRKQRIKMRQRFRGKALTDRRGRGLSGETEADVVAGLENYAYVPKVSEAIKTDITTHYLEAHFPVSMKTLWFCLRDELQKKNSYDESLMRQIFTTGEKYRNLYCQNRMENDP